MRGRVLSQHVQRHVQLGGVWREPSPEVGSEGGRGGGRREGGREVHYYSQWREGGGAHQKQFLLVTTKHKPVKRWI